MAISVNKSVSMFDDPEVLKALNGIPSPKERSNDGIGSGELISNEFTGDLTNVDTNKGIIIDKEKPDEYDPDEYGHTVMPSVIKRVKLGTKDEVISLKNVSKVIDESRRRIGAISPLQQGHLWLIAYAINRGEVTKEDEIDELIKTISTGELHPELTNPNHPDHAKAMERIDKGLIDEFGNHMIEDVEYQLEERDNTSFSTTESKLRDSVVEVLINTTQLGDVLTALAKEKDKIEFARRVRIVTTERKDIPIVTSRTKISVDDLYKKIPVVAQPSTYTMSLPASRYRITLKSLSYSQLISLGLLPEIAVYEDYNRRYSIIYDAIVDTSIGKFKSFEDFLKKTSWEDTTLLMYTLAAATLSSESITVSCPQCGTKATLTYDVKSLIDWNLIPDNALLIYKKTTECITEEDIAENYSHSVINTKVIYELPSKKTLVEFSGISIYDFMRKMSDYVVSNRATNRIAGLEYKYKMSLRTEEMINTWNDITEKDREHHLASLPNFDDNSKVVYALIFSMLAVIHKVIVPIDGIEYELDDPDDIVDYLYKHLEPMDMEVLSKLYIDRIAQYQQRFRVQTNNFCPSKTCSQRLHVNIDPNDDLIFPQASRLTNSEYVLDRSLRTL